ncbi:hypothetical protein MHYMCMPASI_00422 [Hyalomma marginatum]|uniref:Uncharacterized protein n=1 Tax=Hyalomma marginatum TaxID=34627 RepID=A0A8S4BUF8_9ACAR|nr:hypothetical protein MHYMCMPASI_00422 [Hyalomma marginatum]
MGGVVIILRDLRLTKAICNVLGIGVAERVKI